MGGGSNSAAREANAQEQARQAQIAATQSRINQVFDNPQRAADINNFVDATRQYYQQDLNKQKANADRNLTFALAKSGLTGGSAQVDQQHVLGDDYAKGALQVAQKADNAGASLQSSDEEARQRLISLATSGLDSTTAAQQSAEMLRNNLQTSQSGLGSLGDTFGSVNNFVQSAKAAQQRRQGYYSTFGGTRSALYGGGTSGASYGGF